MKKKVRGFYAKLISDLPKYKSKKNISIHDILKFDGRNFWWYLLIAEKNIWLSKAVNRLYHVARLDYISNNYSYDKVEYFLKDKILLDILLISNSKIKYSKLRYSLSLFFKYVNIFFCYYLNCFKISSSTFIKFLLLVPFKKQKTIL